MSQVTECGNNVGWNLLECSQYYLFFNLETRLIALHFCMHSWMAIMFSMKHMPTMLLLLSCEGESKLPMQSSIISLTITRKCYCSKLDFLLLH